MKVVFLLGLVTAAVAGSFAQARIRTQERSAGSTCLDLGFCSKFSATATSMCQHIRAICPVLCCKHCESIGTTPTCLGCAASGCGKILDPINIIPTITTTTTTNPTTTTTIESSTCNWGFDDFRYWGSDDCFYTCGGGTNQAKGSPINIVTASVVANSDTIVDTDNDGTGDMDIGFITDMQSEEYNQSWGMCGTDMKGEWERKGYTFQFSRTDTMMIPKLQYRSPFTNKDDNYVFAQIHCHWADGTTTQGSEHTIDGTPYPLECHYVHAKEGYAAAADPSATPPVKSYLEEADGLLVIGVMYELEVTTRNISERMVQMRDPETRQTVMRDQTLWIKEVGDQAAQAADHEFTTGAKLKIEQYNHNHLWSALVTGLSEGYYTYKGSLTTPPCSETVTWIVGKKILKVKDDDLVHLRKLMNNNKQVLKNWRPTQDIGDRTVYSIGQDTNSPDVTTREVPAIVRAAKNRQSLHITKH